MAEETRYFVGLDLGQSADYTALAALERPLVRPGAPPQGRRPPYAVRHLQRWRLGTPYTRIAEDVAGMARVPPLAGCTLVVDQTGVGRGVVEMLDQALHRGGGRCRRLAVTITAGSSAGAEGDSLRVPKLFLASTLQALLQTRRLQVARSLPEAAVLAKELGDFRVKTLPSGAETAEAWRSNQHDDLVLAVALAAWVGEQALPAMAERRRQNYRRVSAYPPPRPGPWTEGI